MDTKAVDPEEFEKGVENVPTIVHSLPYLHEDGVMQSHAEE